MKFPSVKTFEPMAVQLWTIYMYIHIPMSQVSYIRRYVLENLFNPCWMGEARFLLTKFQSICYVSSNSYVLTYQFYKSLVLLDSPPWMHSDEGKTHDSHSMTIALPAHKLHAVNKMVRQMANQGRTTLQELFPLSKF